MLNLLWRECLFSLNLNTLSLIKGFELIQKYYPDFRRTINELQRYSVRGKIDSGILFSLSEANNKELVKTLKAKSLMI